MPERSLLATQQTASQQELIQDKKRLRHQLRAARRALTPRQQQLAAEHLARRITSLSHFQKARSLLLYQASDGEVSTEPLAWAAHSLGKKVYLPVLHPFVQRGLWLVRWIPGQTPLKRNRYGILEPVMQGHGFKRQQRIPPWAVDLVCLPLVGFDAQGARLGMGGGFYDRTFAVNYPRPHHPYLIGLAHACQQVDELPVAPWDIPLDAIIASTEDATAGFF